MVYLHTCYQRVIILCDRPVNDCNLCADSKQRIGMIYTVYNTIKQLILILLFEICSDYNGETIKRQ